MSFVFAHLAVNGTSTGKKGGGVGGGGNHSRNSISHG